MCMNCGCHLPHDQHGHEANITVEDLIRAGEANDQSLRQTVDHIVETLAVYERDERAGGGRVATPAGAVDEPGLARPAGSEPAPQAPRGSPGSES